MGPSADKEHVWFLDTVHPALPKALTRAGRVCHDATAMSQEELLSHAAIRDAAHSRDCVAQPHPFGREHPRTSRPAVDARSGSGLENIDLEVASDLRVAVHSSPEGNRDAVGEHTLGMLLSALHKLRPGDESVRARRWERESHRGRELKSLTVGVMGYGHMGSAFAERLSGMRCRVLAYDKHKEGWGESPIVQTPLPHVEPVGWETFSREVDVVSIHLPWTDETRGLVDDRWLSLFAKPIILINTARGPIVQTRALLRALDDGRVTDACLDVLEHEGLSLESLEGLADPEMAEAFEALLQHPRVLLSPHVAGWTVESLVRLSTVLADKILRGPES